MDQVGRLERISYSPAKGRSLEAEEIRVVPDIGIAEDYHSIKGDARVTILQSEIRNRLEEEDFDGLCFRRFKEHLSVSGLDLSLLKEGDTLKINKGLLKIVKKGKSCHPECRVYLSGEICPLKSTILYAEVLKEGIIKPGDNISVREKTHEFYTF